MNCKRAKHEMALCAGRDLDERGEQELQRHLAACPQCRDQWHRVQATTSLLQRAGEEPPRASGPELWPQLQTALCRIDRERPAARKFRLAQLWVPTVAVAALALAVVSISQTLLRPAVEDDSLITGPGVAREFDPRAANSESPLIAPAASEYPEADPRSLRRNQPPRSPN